MVARKERTLLIDVQSLDAQSAPPNAALLSELREAVKRATNLASVGGSVPPLSSRLYSREARLCAVRTSLAGSRDVRTAIGSIRYVQQWPVKLTVVRVFGNERLARREFDARCEAALWRLGEDADAQKAVRGVREKLSEMQKS